MGLLETNFKTLKFDYHTDLSLLQDANEDSTLRSIQSHLLIFEYPQLVLKHLNRKIFRLYPETMRKVSFTAVAWFQDQRRFEDSPVCTYKPRQ